MTVLDTLNMLPTDCKIRLGGSCAFVYCGKNETWLEDFLMVLSNKERKQIRNAIKARENHINTFDAFWLRELGRREKAVLLEIEKLYKGLEDAKTKLVENELKLIQLTSDKQTAYAAYLAHKKHIEKTADGSDEAFSKLKELETAFFTVNGHYVGIKHAITTGKKTIDSLRMKYQKAEELKEKHLADVQEQTAHDKTIDWDMTNRQLKTLRARYDYKPFNIPDRKVIDIYDSITEPDCKIIIFAGHFNGRFWDSIEMQKDPETMYIIKQYTREETEEQTNEKD